MTSRVVIALTASIVVLAVSSGVAACAASPMRDAAIAAASATQQSAAKRTLEGVIRVLATDTVPGQSSDADSYQQVLVVNDESYFLKGKKTRPNRQVRVVGAVSGNEIEVESIQDLGPAPG